MIITAISPYLHKNLSSKKTDSKIPRNTNRDEFAPLSARKGEPDKIAFGGFFNIVDDVLGTKFVRGQELLAKEAYMRQIRFLRENVNGCHMQSEELLLKILRIVPTVDNRPDVDQNFIDKIAESIANPFFLDCTSDSKLSNREAKKTFFERELKKDIILNVSALSDEYYTDFKKDYIEKVLYSESIKKCKAKACDKDKYTLVDTSFAIQDFIKDVADKKNFHPFLQKHKEALDYFLDPWSNPPKKLLDLHAQIKLGDDVMEFNSKNFYALDKYLSITNSHTPETLKISKVETSKK